MKREKSKRGDLDPADDAVFDVPESERELLLALLADPELDIMHEFYWPVRNRLAFYLEKGYRPLEVAAEFAVSTDQLAVLKGKCPVGFWDTHSNAARKWLGRKRARLLLDGQGQDLDIVGRLDSEWSAKREEAGPSITYNILQYGGDLPKLAERPVVEAEITDVADGS
jgi:hypothetical protein